MDCTVVAQALSGIHHNCGWYIDILLPAAGAAEPVGTAEPVVAVEQAEASLKEGQFGYTTFET